MKSPKTEKASPNIEEASCISLENAYCTAAITLCSFAFLFAALFL
jgi:hypothetical protein